MTDKDVPTGELFSRVYLEPGAPEQDSKRFRRRIAAFFDQELSSYNSGIGNLIEKELGVQVPSGARGPIVSRFLVQSRLRDMLSAITLIWKYLDKQLFLVVDEADAAGWHEFVSRCLKEENLGYRLDKKCGIHPFVDKEFERNRLSALACLSESRYQAVAAAFEEAHDSLIEDPPNTKGAVRSVFESLEILYKLIANAGEGTRLNAKAVNKTIKPLAQEVYRGDKTAGKTSEHLLDGLRDWIDAAHMYRHGQKSEEPVNPPMGVAIHFVSAGASFIRWLAELDSFESES